MRESFFFFFLNIGKCEKKNPVKLFTNYWLQMKSKNATLTSLL